MSLHNFIACVLLPWLMLLLLESSKAVSEAEEPQTYIIQMDHAHKPETFSTHESWHRSTLRSLSNPVDEKEMFLYSYNHVLNGFSARLTASQLAEIERSPAHVGTYRESFGKLFTTYSPEFLGLNPQSGIWPNASYGEGVIIGILDTGIWPESESFNDKGMPPVPKRWKGQCENGTAFSASNCNWKLIGARSFSKGLVAAGINISSAFDYNSTRDFAGHGTHTSSTAAGNYVPGVSHFGYARGTARGVAPSAHLAMYKVLFATDSEVSATTDVLAGMDQAVADGVDIMSLSLGFEHTPYFNDVIAIASLSAIEKGIFVVCAAGNDGWGYNTTYNGAPWITTVGAGTLDRSFTATMTRNDGFTIEGTSYYPESVYIEDSPFYYGANGDKAICNPNSLNQTEVHRRIVICDNTNKSDVVGQMQELARVGAYAGILVSDSPFLDPEDYTIPGLVIPTASGPSVKYSVNEITVRKAKMKFMSTEFGKIPAPQVAYFSSRGPDPINPGVLKPDILAPGVDIVAAVIPKPMMDIGKNYKLATDYALKSGTSMAAPHVAGVAALLKSIHPEWSPAAMRSAIMTTAYTIDSNHTTIKDQWTGLPATPLAFGAGHIDPTKAMDPGLIYDVGLQDYINFICSFNYTAKQMSAILRTSQWNCSQEQSDLNYPSFIALFNIEAGSPMAMNFSRTVTNVGGVAAVYQATLDIPSGMRITVNPSTLNFTQKYQKLSFSVSLEIDTSTPTVVYGYLKWIDQQSHIVSSPIVAVKR